MQKKPCSEIQVDRKKFKRYVRKNRELYDDKRERLVDVGLFKSVGEWKVDKRNLNLVLTLEYKSGEIFNLRAEVYSFVGENETYFIDYVGTGQVKLLRNIFGLPKESLTRLLGKELQDYREIKKVLHEINQRLIHKKFIGDRRYIKAEEDNGQLKFIVTIRGFTTWGNGIQMVLRTKDIGLEVEKVDDIYGKNHVKYTEGNKRKIEERLSNLLGEYRVGIKEVDGMIVKIELVKNDK